MLCFAPVVLLGSLLTLHPNVSHPTSLDGGVLEVQSCEDGLGLNLKAATSGIYSGTVQYGMIHHEGDWSFGVTPNLGVGVLEHHVPELSTRVNFSLGLQLSAGYQRGRIAVEYWHQSNAHTGTHNAGLDLLAIMGGWVF